MSRHRVALGLVFAVALAWSGLMAWTLGRAAPASANLVAVFAPGTSSEAGFRAIHHADATPVRGTWLAFAWVVEAGDAAAIARLRGAGALWVAPAEAWWPLMRGGCGFDPAWPYPAKGD
ncbi:MAG: hypothetical protein EA356_01700 [Geminicoccaceae bacterium]|nr:MAG: hypothetical protein EA356_01700 [Geminicoccaceae bacterium]